MSFEKRIEFKPAFDKRHDDPKKNYGIHGVDLAFYLLGEKGAIQFIVYTSWHLPHVQDELDSKPIDSRFPFLSHKPMAADLGYHSHKPMYEGQEHIMEDCPLLGWGKCYYDGSGLNAEKVFKVLTEEGSDGVWKYLENYYNETFEGV